MLGTAKETTMTTQQIAAVMLGLVLLLGVVARIFLAMGKRPVGEPPTFWIEPFSDDPPTKTVQWSDQQPPNDWES